MQIVNSQTQGSVFSSYEYTNRQTVSLNKPVFKPIAPKKTLTDEAFLELKTRQMLLILEVLMGKKIQVTAFNEKAFSSQPKALSTSPIVTYERMQNEKSSMDLSFEGKVQTAEGKEMAFSLSIQWKQEFIKYDGIRMQDGKELQDPLIISLDGTPPVLSEKVNFNLNEKANQINKLTNNSGYLVRDANNNRLADDGTELFGPQTSDGFAELSVYDEDKNGWIDSNDAIFKQLYLWNPQEDASGMISLYEAGIGAISLETLSMDYTQKSDIDTPIANYKEASVALGENGESYGVFSVDLVS